MSDDYFYLCWNCGSITPFAQWQMLCYSEEFDRLVLAPPGYEDPVLRCPTCRWDHTDDDANPGISDGRSVIALEDERKAAMAEWGEHWCLTLETLIKDRRAVVEEQTTPINVRDQIVDKIRAVAEELDVQPELWLQQVIEEALLAPRSVHGTFVDSGGPIEELYLAIVHMDDGSEELLLWRVMTEMGEQMIPVFAKSEEGVQRWLENIGFEIGAMDGPELSFRHFPAGDHYTWLRRNPDPSMPDSEREVDDG
jgi:hypothetical protein